MSVTIHSFEGQNGREVSRSWVTVRSACDGLASCCSKPVQTDVVVNRSAFVVVVVVTSKTYIYRTLNVVFRVSSYFQA